MSESKTPGGPQEEVLESGNFGHENLENLRAELTTHSIPAGFESEVAAGRIITLDAMPDGLRVEEPILLPNGDSIRPDRVGEGIFYEAKPNTAESIEAGLQQVNRNELWMNEIKYMEGVTG